MTRYQAILPPHSTRFCTALIATLLLVGIQPLTAATFEGFAEPYQQIDIASGNEPGIIDQIFVHEGQAISKGELVAQLESGVLETSLDIAKHRAQLNGRIDAAAAEYRMRHTRFEKLNQLLREGHASPAEIDRARMDLEVAKAQVELAREDIDLAKLECRRIEAQIEQRRFRSPIDGFVTEIVREVGESTMISDPRLMTLVQLHPLRVKFPVSRDCGTKVREGQTVQIKLPEINQTVNAEVEVVSPVLDAKSGTMQITCVLNNESRQYRAGTRCLLDLEGDAAEPTKDDATEDFSDF